MAYYSEVTELLSHCQCSLKFLESYTVDTKESQNAVSEPVNLFRSLSVLSHGMYMYIWDVHVHLQFKLTTMP